MSEHQETSLLKGQETGPCRDVRKLYTTKGRRPEVDLEFNRLLRHNSLTLTVMIACGAVLVVAILAWAVVFYVTFTRAANSFKMDNQVLTSGVAAARKSG